MAKCEQCGATIVFGARPFAGHTFCSTQCIVLAKRAGLREEGEPTPAKPPLRLVVPVLATVHALTPWLLLATRLLERPLGTMTNFAIAIFWSWPLWLWPLLRYRARRTRSTMVALVVSFLALAAAALPMLATTIFSMGLHP